MTTVRGKREAPAIPTKPAKCTVGSRGRYCGPLSWMLHETTAKHGLESVLTPVLSSGKASLTMVAAYRPTPKSMPAVLNYCPWCGTDIRRKGAK